MGNWENGSRQGAGEYKWKIEDNKYDRYYGEWENDIMHGLGTFHKANGDVFIGNWIKGKRTSLGKQIFNDGTYCEGYWEDDKMQGEGACYSEEGDVLKDGEWNKHRHI